jgi:hypothetical protein
MNNRSIVAHPIFGEGIVVATRWDGAQARVKFRSGLRLWLPAKWLKPILLEHVTLNQISSKRLLEAFRLGVVPHQDIEFFTFGRAYEISEIKQCLTDLKRGRGGVYLIEGVYGSGKTHLLEYTRHLSLKQGFATAYCELSTQETPLHRPKYIYRELIHNLRYIKTESEYYFRDLLRQATSIEIDDHCFLTPVLKRLKDIDLSDMQTEVFWQWVEGESTKNYAIDPISPYRVRGGQRIPALYDFSTATDFYSYIFTGLSFLAHQLGLGGLVIIFDEVETITHTWNYSDYTRGLNFLEGLIRSALNCAELKRIENRMQHNRVRPTPYSYREPHLLLILATTPTHGLRGLEELKNLIDKKTYLRNFTEVEIEVIYDNLLEVYTCAYPHFRIDAPRREHIFKAALQRSKRELREFIKFSSEAFDWFRLSNTEDATSSQSTRNDKRGN